MSENKEIMTIEIDGQKTVLMVKDIPALVNGKFETLVLMESQVKTSIEKAKTAQKSAENAQNKVKFSLTGKKEREAIEKLQSVAGDLADSGIAMSEALELSFKFQNDLANISQFLLKLGVSNIAANRTIVRELEARLNGATEEELSELAQKEIEQVIAQLNEQRDIMEKQTRFSENLKEVNDKLEDNEEYDREQDERISDNTRQIEENREILEEHQQVTKENKAKIEQNADVISQHEEELNAQKQVDAIHEEQIKSLGVADDEQDKLISKNEENISKNQEKLKMILEKTVDLDHKNDLNEKRIEEIVDSIYRLTCLIQETNKKLAEIEANQNKKGWQIAVSVASGVSLILSLLQVFNVF